MVFRYFQGVWKPNTGLNWTKNPYYEYYFENPEFFIGLAHRQTHISNFRVLIFVLKLFRDVAVLYFFGKFAQSKGVLYFTVSKPYLTVFFESFEII